jgi:hypothetical protein
MLSYSRHTTNSFEATNTTEAGLFVLVWVLKPEKEGDLPYPNSTYSEKD